MSETKPVKGEEVLEAVVVEDDAVVTQNEENSELAPLSSSSLAHYDEETQREILRIANEIDVTQFEKIMAYGSIPIVRSFESAGRILQEAQGTSADQEVVKMVTELAKQAKDSYNLVIEEPNFLQKFIMKITTGLKSESKEVKVRAISCFKILEQYIKSCDMWIETLRKAHDDMMLSAHGEKNDCYELEQYIVAGYIAMERIAGEVEEARKDWEETGIIETKDRYDMLSEGMDIFQVVLLNLEKSRGAYGLSLGQLALQVKANRNIQIAIRTQKMNSSSLAAQQLRNAYFDAVNREALEGQKAITQLNNELMKKVAEGSKLTAEESERILVSGVYTVESALIAAQTVIDGCKSIKKIREERVGEISAQMDKLKVLVDELAPYVEGLKKDAESSTASTPNDSSSSKSGLVF